LIVNWLKSIIAIFIIQFKKDQTKLTLFSDPLIPYHQN